MTFSSSMCLNIFSARYSSTVTSESKKAPIGSGSFQPKVDYFIHLKSIDFPDLQILLCYSCESQLEDKQVLVFLPQLLLVLCRLLSKKTRRILL